MVSVISVGSVGSVVSYFSKASMTNPGIAIITGGTSGIGLAAARLLLATGHNVYLWARNQQRGKEVADQLNGENRGGTATYQFCDVGSSQSIQEAVRTFAAQHDRVDILINAAGILQRTPLADYQPEIISQQIDIVLKGTILTTTALAGFLVQSKNAVVVNMGSVVGQQAFVGLSAYGAAKAGIAHFTRTAAQELYSSGTRVVCVCPGIVKTNLMTEAEYQALVGVTPGRRLQSVDEVARFIVDLTRPDYPSLTGAVIDFDDGLGLFPSNRPPAPPTSRAPATGLGEPTHKSEIEKSEIEKSEIRNPQSAIDSDPVLNRVAKVFHEVFAVAPEEVHMDTGPEDIARWDSLGNLRLIAALEKEFQCSLDVNEIMEMVDVATIVKTMKSKG